MGEPRIERTEEVEAVIRAIDAVYDIFAVGGHGHIVFDDWNVGDDDVDYCLNESVVSNNEEPLDRAVVDAALRLIRRYTPEQRAAILAMRDGGY